MWGAQIHAFIGGCNEVWGAQIPLFFSTPRALGGMAFRTDELGLALLGQVRFRLQKYM